MHHTEEESPQPPPQSELPRPQPPTASFPSIVPAQPQNPHEQWKKLHASDFPALAGMGAGWINILITFPINKFSFRQQVESTNPEKTWNNLRHYFSTHGNVRNVLYVYRACSIPLMQKTIANSIMYGVYSKERSRLGDSGQLSARKACLLACTYAGGIEALVCSPLERCQSVLQDRRNDTKFRGLRDVVLWHSQRGTMMKSIRSLYTGLSLVFIRNTLSSFVYFQIRDIYKKNYAKPDKALKWYTHATFGCLSGAIGCTLFFWLNTVKSKLQADLRPRSAWSVAKYTFKTNSDTFHRGFYYGWKIAVFRSALSWGIQNAAYEYFTSVIH